VHGHVQRLVSVVKMATVLEVYTTEVQRYLVRLCGHKDSMQRIFVKKYFLFTVGSVCRVKRFTTGSRNSLKNVQNLRMMSGEVRKMAEKTVKRLLCCGIPHTEKATGQVYQCSWGICG
jgi:hypothetical protein